MSDTWDVVGGRTWPAEFLRGAAARPQAVALQGESGASVTRDGLRRQAAALRTALIEQHAVTPGDRIGILVENGLPYAALVIAIAAAGAVSAPISRKLTAEEVNAQVRVSGLKLVVVEAGAPDVDVAPTVRLDQLLAAEEADEIALQRMAAAVAALDIEDHSTIICTSGTTSAPKPIVLSHGNISFAVATSALIYAIGEADVGLTVFPWAHSNGHINQLLCWLTLGVRIVVAERFTASGFPGQLERYAPTIAPLNGTHIKMVLARLPDGVETVDSPLRIIPTALELDADSAQRFCSVFGATLRKVWYQTETIAPHTVLDLLPPRTTVNDNPLGHPGLGHMLRLVGENGETVGPGEPGELHVKPFSRQSIAVGRLDPDTHELIPYDRDAWWPTGDLAVAELDGFLYYAGRIKEMVKRSGHNVALPEVNEVILGHPAVTDVMTFGMPDPMREEQIIAAVVFADEPQVDGVLDWCRERLADYKVPSDVIVFEEIPRTELGKTDVRGIRERYEQSHRVPS